MARRALGAATLTAVQALDRALVPADRSLVVACSGGPDSLALAVAAAEVARRGDKLVSGLVVNHGLQPGADATAAGVLIRLAELGLSAEVQRVEVLPAGDGPEAAARAARYELLTEVAEQRRATILLGHTLDDQAETVLLGLARGSGTRSLSGMAGRRGPLLRPFLELRRSLTEAVCVEAGVRPWLDPHNTEPTFARVRVRHRVLPVLERELGPGIAEALARTARLARRDADLLDELARDHRPGIEADCAQLGALPLALRGRVLRTWLRASGADDLAADHLDAVERLVTDWHGQGGIDVPGGTVRRVAGRLRYDRSSGREPGSARAVKG